jgi:hypothetical protein
MYYMRIAVEVGGESPLKAMESKDDDDGDANPNAGAAGGLTRRSLNAFYPKG